MSQEVRVFKNSNLALKKKNKKLPFVHIIIYLIAKWLLNLY